MSVVIAALIPVTLLIATGYALRRMLITNDTHWIGIERLTYFVLFPALLVGTLSRADLSQVPVAGVGLALFLPIVVMATLCLALRRFLARRIGLDGPAFTSLFQGATRWNTFIALAVADNLFGMRGLALASVAMVAMIPPLNVANVSVLAHYAAKQEPRWRDIGGALLKNPLIWGCVIGLLWNLSGIPSPKPLHAFIDALGRCSLALGVLLVGVGLIPSQLLRPAPATLITTALKMGLMPAMAILLGLASGLRGENLVIVAVCASVPAASTAYVLARQMGGDALLMAQILTVQTIVAAATMPVAIALASLWSPTP